MHRIVYLIFALFCFCTPSIVLAAEVIHSFNARVELAKNGSLNVTETIIVQAEGKAIRRGIFRDFPLLFEDTDGKQKKVGFKLLSVKRDGRPDGSRVVKNREYIRIYIGEEDYFLPRNRKYTYEIKYQTDRQIRFFESHDELFWNVTGNFWNFPIEKSSANFILPSGVVATDVAGFTGKYGSTEQAVTIRKNGNLVSAVATRRLNKREGMSIAIKMPEGSIDAPSEAQKTAWFWQDNINMIMCLFALSIVTFYYFVSWWMVGRDPKSGVIVPRWDAPDGISPALINYIHNKGLNGKGFDAISAAILNLAVKGLIKIEKASDTITLRLDNESGYGLLPVGERSILNRLKVSDDGKLTISKDHGSQVKKLQEGFATAMESEHRGKYYEGNRLSFIGGIFLSLIVLGSALLVGEYTDDMLGLLFSAGFMTVFVSIFALSFVKRFAAYGSLLSKIFSIVMTGIFTFSALSSVFIGLADTFLNAKLGDDMWLLVSVVGILVLNILFFFLLGAPTQLGRKKMDGIEGLKTYLTLAEKDRMNMRDAPDFSQEHYEELLPYAVALGVEKPWSQTFEKWLAAAVAAGAVAAAAYRPDWYSGRSFDGDSLSDTMGDFTDSMQSGFSSAMPVPKSSSSGFSSGGGFSGGGGGGGGGGGW